MSLNLFGHGTHYKMLGTCKKKQKTLKHNFGNKWPSALYLEGDLSNEKCQPEKKSHRATSEASKFFWKRFQAIKSLCCRTSACFVFVLFFFVPYASVSKWNPHIIATRRIIVVRRHRYLRITFWRTLVKSSLILPHRQRHTMTWRCHRWKGKIRFFPKIYWIKNVFSWFEHVKCKCGKVWMQQEKKC